VNAVVDAQTDGEARDDGRLAVEREVEQRHRTEEPREGGDDGRERDGAQ